jgi:hypothetical protein
MAATLGELVLSPRAPFGLHTKALQPSGSPDVYCLWCLTTINNDHLEFWEDGVGIEEESVECVECQAVRCWRGFDCECVCHEETWDTL